QRHEEDALRGIFAGDLAGLEHRTNVGSLEAPQDRGFALEAPADLLVAGEMRVDDLQRDRFSVLFPDRVVDDARSALPEHAFHLVLASDDRPRRHALILPSGRTPRGSSATWSSDRASRRSARSCARPRTTRPRARAHRARRTPRRARDGSPRAAAS